MATGFHDVSDETIDVPVAGARREILDAAASCFFERGYSATSIDDVARRLGSTKGRIYHHYASKADLFGDVFKTGMDMNFRAILPEFSADCPTHEKLARMARTHTRQMIETKPYQRAVWEGVEMHIRSAAKPGQRSTLTELLAYRDRYSDLFKTTLSECRENGLLDFENLSIANQVMFVALNSPLFWYSPEPGKHRAELDSVIDQVVAIVMRGLGYKGDLTS